MNRNITIREVENGFIVTATGLASAPVDPNGPPMPPMGTTREIVAPDAMSLLDILSDILA